MLQKTSLRNLVWSQKTAKPSKHERRRGTLWKKMISMSRRSTRDGKCSRGEYEGGIFCICIYTL